MKDAGISAEDLPTVSVSVAEEEITGIGADNITDHLVAWNSHPNLSLIHISEPTRPY